MEDFFYYCNLEEYGKDCAKKETCLRHTHFDKSKKNLSARLFNICYCNNFSMYLKDTEITEKKEIESVTNESELPKTIKVCGFC